MAGLRGYVNNFSTLLDENISDSDTTFDIVDATGLSAEITATNGYVALTITDGTNTEIVYVTGVSSNTITVVRGQEGTSAEAFVNGDKIECRATRDSFVKKPFGFSAIEANQNINDATLTKINLISGTGGFDIGGSLDFTNDRLAPIVPGYYWIDLIITLNSMTAGKKFELHMKDESAGFPYQSWTQGAGNSMTTHRHSVIHFFNGSTNWLEFYTRHDEGGALTIRQDASRLLFRKLSEV